MGMECSERLPRMLRRLPYTNQLRKSRGLRRSFLRQRNRREKGERCSRASVGLGKDDSSGAFFATHHAGTCFGLCIARDTPN